MFASIDTMISLGIIFLVLSMVLKYIMSLVKRLLKTKAHVAGREMKIFIGENTSQFLKHYAKHQAKHLNLLHRTSILHKKEGFRHLKKEELKEISFELRNFLEGENVEALSKKLGIDKDSELFGKIDVVKDHLDALQNKAETIYDNTLRKINEEYKKRIQLWTFAIGFILTISINASFFDIYESISTNSSMREQLVYNSNSIIDEMKEIEDQISDAKGGDTKNIRKEIENAKKDIKNIADIIPKRKQLFGWEKGEFGETMGFNKLMGFFISALLISFGAPFWHDFLKSFINIRKTVAGSGGKTGSS
jgi:hypothetical protein